MNNRGSLADTVYGPIYLLIIGITMVVCFYLWNTTAASFLALPSTQAVNQSINTTITGINPAFNTFDYMIPFVVGGLLITSTILAYKRGASILYIGLALIFWVLALMLSAVFSNVFIEFTTNPLFTSTMTSFPILNWVMTNIKWVVLGWLFVLSIVMFSRNKREEQNISAAEQAFTQ